VKFSLRPQDNAFYDFFSRAAQNLVRGTEMLSELALPGVDVQSVSERLGEVEHDSDSITHELYTKINSTFITPFDREDIYDLGSGLTAAAMPRLKGMKGLKEYWVEINRLENEGDRAYRMLLVRLFSGEYDALTVLKMKEVADELEKACDAFEHVANTIETISVKES